MKNYSEKYTQLYEKGVSLREIYLKVFWETDLTIDSITWLIMEIGNISNEDANKIENEALEEITNIYRQKQTANDLSPEELFKLSYDDTQRRLFCVGLLMKIFGLKITDAEIISIEALKL